MSINLMASKVVFEEWHELQALAAVKYASNLAAIVAASPTIWSCYANFK